MNISDDAMRSLRNIHIVVLSGARLPEPTIRAIATRVRLAARETRNDDLTRNAIDFSPTGRLMLDKTDDILQSGSS